MVLQLGLNPGPKVLECYEEAIELCAKQGVERVIVATGYPYSHACSRQDQVRYGLELSQDLAKKFGNGGQIEHTQIEFKDLYAVFGDGQGRLKPQYDEMKNDIHAPKAVMQEGLAYLLS